MPPVRRYETQLIQQPPARVQAQQPGHADAPHTQASSPSPTALRLPSQGSFEDALQFGLRADAKSGESTAANACALPPPSAHREALCTPAPRQRLPRGLFLALQAGGAISPALYEFILAGHLDKKNLKAAVTAWCGMHTDGVVPAMATTERLVQALSAGKSWSQLLHVLHVSRDHGQKMSNIITNALRTAAARDGEGGVARAVFEIYAGTVISKPECDCIVDELCKAGKLEAADGFLQELARDPRVQVDIHAYEMTLAALAARGDKQKGDFQRAENLLAYLENNNRHRRPKLYDILLTAYAKAGDVQEIGKLFMRMQRNHFIPSPAMYNKAGRIFAENGLHAEAAHYWQLGRYARPVPVYVTLAPAY